MRIRVLLSVVAALAAPAAAQAQLLTPEGILRDAFATLQQPLPPPPGGQPGLPPPPGQGGRLPPPPGQGGRLPPPPDDRGFPPPDHRDRDDRFRDRDDHALWSLRQAERDFERANSEYRAAPGGSWTEQRADRERREAYSRTVEAARRLGNGRVDVETLENLAIEFDGKYRAAPGGSLAEQLYDAVRTSAFSSALDSLNYDLPGYGEDFRSIERMAERFDREYRAASGGSRREGFYDQARRRAFDGAYNAFQLYVRRVGRWELRSLGDEYDRKYRAAPGGSVSESYYRRMRDACR